MMQRWCRLWCHVWGCSTVDGHGCWRCCTQLYDPEFVHVGWGDRVQQLRSLGEIWWRLRLGWHWAFLRCLICKVFHRDNLTDQ